MIDGVLLKPLKQILDERGKVMHMLRRDDPEFRAFGEIYFSVVLPGVIKGWHLHREMTLYYAVPMGLIKLVLYDDRSGSPSRGELMEIFTGPESYQLIRIPRRMERLQGPGYRPLHRRELLGHPARPHEIERKDPFDPSIPYRWELVHR